MNSCPRCKSPRVVLEGQVTVVFRYEKGELKLTDEEVTGYYVTAVKCPECGYETDLIDEYEAIEVEREELDSFTERHERILEEGKR